MSLKTIASAVESLRSIANLRYSLFWFKKMGRVFEMPPSWLATDLSDSLTGLLAALVRIPSRGGIDSYEKIFEFIAEWLRCHDVPCTRLTQPDGRIVALAGQVGSGERKPIVVLNAPADTVGFGDAASWTKPPTSAEIADGYLYGRGSADAKAGIAIFCHLLAAFRVRSFAGGLAYVFDADEHTGHFAGIRAYLEQFADRISGVLIGYPGHDRIGVGARGFWRATLRIAGTPAHSGSSRPRGTNAIAKACRVHCALVAQEKTIALPADEFFPLAPKFTVTGIRGGGEFSLVPDACEVDLDVRLTPAFTADAAEARLLALLNQLDAEWPASQPSRIFPHGSLPAYRLPTDSPFAAALHRAGARILGRNPTYAITGPSNIGNLLAAYQIPATCGFGVDYRNAHAVDECVNLSSLVPTYRVYEAALSELLQMENLAT